MAKGGWHPEDIKAAVRKRGTTLTRLALDNGLYESACRVALNRPSLAGERAIAAFLGVSAQSLWPSRYQRDGTPKHPRAGAQDRATTRRGQRLSVKVA
ncbi:helix-turn-helix domain-containing protein [Algihabitans albus]|uniref:helix-turn-helix domain-containing protein n=1 Tax=Algihabitans albus TaxID=2164067 RepID=UPI000E5D0FD0|nr:helix-turn-helix transcriptional regulator [Algihabitans albus]